MSWRRVGVLVSLLGALACARVPSPADEPPAGPFALEVLAGGVGSPRALNRLARDYYGRLVNRRFDSIATYQDPALRELFQSLQAWSDYYADMVQALDSSSFEANRPTRITILRIESVPPAELGAELEPPQQRALVHLRFTGANAKPLRWWSTSMSRVDRWELRGDRWWIIPGKL